MKHALQAVFLALAFCIYSCHGDNEDKAMDHDQKDLPDHHTTASGIMMQSMRPMEQAMVAMELTGNFDYDFANMMVIHHIGAIDMARAYLEHGSDEGLKLLAQNAIIKQQAEIDSLRSFTKNNPPSGTGSPEQHPELSEHMNSMLSEMKGMKMSGNIDKDFALMMIVHHKGAIQMARSEVSHGTAEPFKKMAAQMADDQAKEIAVLEAWISNH